RENAGDDRVNTLPNGARFLSCGPLLRRPALWVDRLGKAESGTEEEFRWALNQNLEHGFPEIKCFFKGIDKFESPSDPASITDALKQWERVISFREELEKVPVFFAEYTEVNSFKDVLDADLGRWLSHPERPWTAHAPIRTTQPSVSA